MVEFILSRGITLTITVQVIHREMLKQCTSPEPLHQMGQY